jgi:hypothetical protein
MSLTTIIVTHDPRIAGQVDRVVAIRDGKTSTETIRQVGQLEQAMIGQLPTDDDQLFPEVTYHEYVVLDSAGRLQVPREHLDRFGIGDRAHVEVVDDGILIRPIAGREALTADQRALSLHEQVTRLFADEKAPDRKGLRSRLRLPRRKKEISDRD